MVLRTRCSPRRRAESARMNAGRKAPSANRIANPQPLRIANISMMRRVPDNARTDTAMAENDSRAPVIHRTTRTRSRWRTLLGVRLAFRTGGVEGGKLVQGGVDRHDVGEPVERHLEAVGIGNLRHDEDVRESDVAAERIGAGLDQCFDRLEPGGDPVRIPVLDGSLV